MAFDFKNFKNLLNDKNSQQKTIPTADSRLFKDVALQDDGAGAPGTGPALGQGVLPEPVYEPAGAALESGTAEPAAVQTQQDLEPEPESVEPASLNLHEPSTPLPSDLQSNIQTNVPQDLPKVSPFLQAQEELSEAPLPKIDPVAADELPGAAQEQNTVNPAENGSFEEPAASMQAAPQAPADETGPYQSTPEAGAQEFFDEADPSLPQDAPDESAAFSQEDQAADPGFLTEHDDAAALDQDDQAVDPLEPFYPGVFDEEPAEALQEPSSQGISSNTKISGIDSDKISRALQQQGENQGLDEVKAVTAQSLSAGTDEWPDAVPSAESVPQESAAPAAPLPQAFMERPAAMPPGARNALESNPLLKIQESSPFDEQDYAAAPSMAEAMGLAAQNEGSEPQGEPIPGEEYAPEPEVQESVMPSGQSQAQPYFEEESAHAPALSLQEPLLPPDPTEPAEQSSVNADLQDLMAAPGTLEPAPFEDKADNIEPHPQDEAPIAPQDAAEPEGVIAGGSQEPLPDLQTPTQLSQVPPAFRAHTAPAQGAASPQDPARAEKAAVSSFIAAQTEEQVELPAPDLQEQALAQAQAMALKYDSGRSKAKLRENPHYGKEAQEHSYGFNFNYQSSSPNYATLAQERQTAADKIKVAGYNDKETVPVTMTILLYARQLAASFFTHSTLGVVVPRLAMRLGPSYPSSTAFSFLVLGLIVGLIGVLALNIFDVMVAAGIVMIVYVLLCGLTEYRGIGVLIGLFSKRRTDNAIDAASVIFPAIICIVVMQVFLGVSTGPEIILCLAVANMVAGAASSSLYFDLPQDPVDSLGTMSAKGLIFTVIFTVVVSLALLEIQIAGSILGIALFLRLVFGQYLINHNQNASRLHVSALRHIILQAVMIDFIILGKDFNLLNHRLLEEVISRFCQ